MKLTSLGKFKIKLDFNTIWYNKEDEFNWLAVYAEDITFHCENILIFVTTRHYLMLQNNQFRFVVKTT